MEQVVTQEMLNEVMAAATEAKFIANNLWLLVATVLVFIMHLGFAALEAGFVQKKNVVNILFKNVMIVSIGLLTYYLIGFNLMYPGTNVGGFFAFTGFGLTPPEGGLTSAYGSYTYYTDFIFQGMFAATCCTIVSGAYQKECENIKEQLDFLGSMKYLPIEEIEEMERQVVYPKQKNIEAI